MQAIETNKRLVKFIVAAVLFFAWGVVQGALQAQGPIHEFITQGPAAIIVGAHVHVNLLGWVSLLLAAVVYYLVPVLSGKPIAAPRLINWIFWVFVIGFTIQAVLMITVGIRAGNAFIAGVVGPQLEALMTPYMMPIGILSIICGIVWLLFVVQILVTVGRKS
ncbi:MAG: cbb3-type cytochrome c oxidase subunit I [Dehalococcoidales bacterium]|nr:cbb3-type cytochrome c oxidase subunit I [Dehalococcoidales bacterium]